MSGTVVGTTNKMWTRQGVSVFMYNTWHSRTRRQTFKNKQNVEPIRIVIISAMEKK